MIHFLKSRLLGECNASINITVSGKFAGLGVYFLRLEPMVACCKSSVAPLRERGEAKVSDR